MWLFKNSTLYCVDCLPDGIDVDSEDVSPIFADSEWNSYPVCCECGAKHDYVSLTPDGVKNKKHTYRINIDERGEFNADVIDCNGRDIYSINNDNESHEILEVTFGFMKHAKDLKGLMEHLKSTDIIGKDATIELD
jgi:hypothetical protein